MINNFRYAVDITLMALNEKEIKNLLMKVQEKGDKLENSKVKDFCSSRRQSAWNTERAFRDRA